MGRYRSYNPDQSFFHIVDAKTLKENNPLLSAIDSFIEQHVSLKPFEAKLRNEMGGAPAVHPKMMLKILFYSYANGVYSSRDIEERMSWDPHYIYLCCIQKVDHSTICDFILQYQEEIKEIFTKVVYVLQTLGYVTLDFVALDGTKIKADGNKEFSGTVKDFQEKKEKIEKKISECFELSAQAEEPEKYKARREKKVKELRGTQEKIDKFLQELEQKPDKENDSAKYNLTDTDARMVKDKEAHYMGYNGQVIVDGKADVIIAAEIFNTSSDQALFKPMIEKMSAQISVPVQNMEIAGDAGYSTSGNLSYCQEQNLTAYLPLVEQRTSVSRIEAADCQIKTENGKRLLICPGGQTMEASQKLTKNGRGFYFYRFRPQKQLCRSCPLMSRCYSSPNGTRFFTVKREVFDGAPAREQMRERISSPKGKQRMADRSCLVEHVFGEIKELFGFRRFMHRGLNKVRLIWIMVCIGYNFRKLARFNHPC